MNNVEVINDKLNDIVNNVDILSGCFYSFEHDFKVIINSHNENSKKYLANISYQLNDNKNMMKLLDKNLNSQKKLKTANTNNSDCKGKATKTK